MSSRRRSEKAQANSPKLVKGGASSPVLGGSTPKGSTGLNRSGQLQAKEVHLAGGALGVPKPLKGRAAVKLVLKAAVVSEDGKLKPKFR